MNIKDKQHYLTLDSFRGICACLVALSHFNANSLLSNTPLLDYAAIYVDFFFVLSGFVIFANYGERLREGYSKAKFIFLRFGRLYPLHFFVLMAFIAVDLVQVLIPSEGLSLYRPFSAPGEGIGDIAANLFLVHSLHVSEHLAFNGPSWSISTEFYTYILFAFILGYAGKYYRIAVVTIGLASAVVLFLLYGNLYAKLNYGFLRCVFGFACGAMTYELFSEKKIKFNSFLASGKKAGFIECAVFICALVYILLFSAGALSMFAPLVFGAVIFVFAFEKGFISEFMKCKLFLFLGALSYSIYMNHMFISGKIFAFPARLIEKFTGWQITMPGKGGYPVFGPDIVTGTLIEIVYLLVVIGFSFATFKLIEEPCRNWSRRVANRKAHIGSPEFSKA
jgi:peptidoglycan/LPS O-acetylase OafA/YrhL